MMMLKMGQNSRIEITVIFDPIFLGIFGSSHFSDCSPKFPGYDPQFSVGICVNFGLGQNLTCPGESELRRKSAIKSPSFGIRPLL